VNQKFKQLLLGLPVLLGLIASLLHLSRRFRLQKRRERNNARVQEKEKSTSEITAQQIHQIHLHVAPGTRIRLILEGYPDRPITPSLLLRTRQSLSEAWSSRLKERFAFETALLAGSIIIYLATRLAALENFPIFFFTDEAIQTVMAADFIQSGLRNYQGELLPTYFSNGPTYNLSSVSVYLQVLPYLLFGKSVFLTRAVSVFITMLAALAVSFTLRDVFKSPYWWSGALLLSTAPAWFYHSRTAFETAEMASFYAVFIYLYMLYRVRSPRYLYPALVMGALVFYTYSPGQIIMAATGLILLASDQAYHRRNWKTALKGLLVLFVLAIPFIRYSLAHETVNLDHLAMRAPYLFQPLPLAEKISRIASTYFRSISPAYWYLPHEHDLARHLMKGYGHLLLSGLPFAILGLGTVLKKLHLPQNRALLAALLAVPLGSMLVGTGITRLLAFVIPAILLTGIGLSIFLLWLENPRVPKWLSIGTGWKLPRSGIAAGVFTILALVNIVMLRDALINGPTWYQDYSLGGMQYGARQVFGSVKEIIEKEPETKVILSPTWTNGADMVARFFLGTPLPIQMGSISGHLNRQLSLDDNTLFILTPEEFVRASESNKFSKISVENTLPYPNQQVGFYFARMAYVEDIELVLETEYQARRVLQTADVPIGDEFVQVGYSYLDMGSIDLLFDQNPYTFARTYEANPFQLEFHFPVQRQIKGISFTIGSILAEITVKIDTGQDGIIREFSEVLRGTVERPSVLLDFGDEVVAQSLRLQIKDSNQPEPGHVHIWELVFH
jgi:4-amino-4-deoxy-L-arabinose transferase-like glycosyltransferase